MDSFLKTFLILLLVYFGLRILFRLYGPLIIRWFARRLARRFERQFQAYHSQTQQDPQQQSRTVDQSQKPGRNNSDKGEYIEYEEID